MCLKYEENQNKTPLFINVNHSNVWGHQFVAMCSGENHRSYLGTGFHRISWKGLPGEHIWGGDYKYCTGSGGKSVLSIDEINNLSVSPTKSKITKGLVAGRNGVNDYSTIFRIYLQSSNKGTENFSIGQVESDGFDFIKFAIGNEGIDNLIIGDCGIVISTC